MYKELIKNYQPKDEQEVVDKALILSFIERNEDCLTRENLVAHITSSAFVVDQTMSKVLFAYHNIYDSWGWVGGHNDGDEDLLGVAIKEAKEETGLKEVKPFNNDILTLDVIYVENHIKNGKYVPDHLHLNVAFLLVADTAQSIQNNPKENQGVKWFTFDEVFEHISEPRMVPVYLKAFKAIKALKKAA